MADPHLYLRNGAWCVNTRGLKHHRRGNGGVANGKVSYETMPEAMLAAQKISAKRAAAARRRKAASRAAKVN